MSGRRPKITPFARFFIFMIFVAPVAFVGASYYNGEDGIENLKRLLNFEKKESIESVEIKSPEETKVVVNSQLRKLQDEMTFKTRKIDSLYLENSELKDQLKETREELEQVQKQLDRIKSAIGQ